MTDLLKLAALVEAGEQIAAQEAWELADALGGVVEIQHAVIRITSAPHSLDAAEALRSVALPGWRITHAYWSNDDAKFNLTKMDVIHYADRLFSSGCASSPSNALFAAILRAKAQEPELCQDEGCPHYGTDHVCNPLEHRRGSN